MRLQKRLAAHVLGCSPYRVRFDQARVSEIGEAITKEDIRRLVAQGAISRVQVAGVSRARAKKMHVQKTKGRRRGQGSRKAVASARQDPKDVWMMNVRKQRLLLKKLKAGGFIAPETFKTLYARSKGNFFRSTRHIKMYIAEQGLIVKK